MRTFKLVPSATYGWMNCDANVARAAGWHKFSIERLADITTVNFTVDDVATRTLTGVTAQNWNTVLIGGGSGTTGITAYWDDVLVEYFDPPSVTAQPTGQSVALGGSATFSVGAINNPQTYQWRLNGVNISGATTSSLTVNNAQAADAGSYTVEVANGVGPTTSTAAVLLVAPAITTQPVSRTSPAGATVTFTVAAAGQTPLSYRWQKNGADLSDGGIISGAQSATLTLTGVGQSDAGTYTVGVTNAAGGVLSAGASLVIMVPPVITTQPASQTVGTGGTVTFGAVATGTAPLSYQWAFKSSPIPGATGSSYTRSNVQAADAGAYTLTVTNLAGSATSDPATLLVNTPPSLAAIPDRTVHAGTVVSLTAAATDPEVPPQTLSFSLDAGPVGAAINPGTGVFTWTTGTADVGTTKTFTVRVTDNGTPSESATRTFSVVVVAPVVIASAVVTSNTITLTWDAIPGQAYHVQFTEDFSAPDWADLADVTASGQTASFAESIVNDFGSIPHRFYRILVR